MSRRRKQLNLSIETLEDRRVMSAQSPLAAQGMELVTSLQANQVSYSSATTEGQLQIFLDEISRQALQAGVNGEAVNTTLSVPSDPLLDDQWYILNNGQQVGNPDFQVIFGTPGEDLNVAPVWNQGFTGEGVVVAVIDSGVEFTHPDLDANIDPLFQFDALDGDTNASPVFLVDTTTNAHGTAVAGIIGAEANDIGGVGIAPDVQLVPIRLIDFGQTSESAVDAFRFGTEKIDITNNSWGPAVVRGLAGPTAREILALRDTVVGPDSGRDGLGTIHVFASGNSGQQNDSSNYNGWVNSRYTIGVTGTDHDGAYNNVDGTVTGYMEIGSSVLVAAPTGSVALSIANDTGVGSGVVTTDTRGDTGFNQLPDPESGEQLDRDFLEDEAYTSRFNGTSSSAPMVSGVIALMLEANPSLSYRDVQEILVRSSRQNSKFDTLANGVDKSFGIEYQSTWITNQVPLFHDPDIWDPLIENFNQLITPTLDPSLAFFTDAHYAPTPQVLTNGAGYTVSQGRGTNLDHIGFAHGVVDAELAVQMALQWTSKGQHLPNELTFTTATNTPGVNNLPAAALIDDGGLDFIVPGGLGGGDAFADYFEEYFADEPDFSQDFDARGVPFELSVTSPNDMKVENVEITVDISGGTVDALDNLRIVLVSPNGTHSELNPYYVDPSFAIPEEKFHQANLLTHQANGLNGVSTPENFIDPGSVDTGGDLVFTFSTNRIWGERSDDALMFDPTTGEPIATLPGAGGNNYNVVPSNAGDFFTQGWQLHFENYSTATLAVDSIEAVWHGSPIGANTRRISGLVGVDDNRDDFFNYSRVTQEFADLDGDPSTLRLGEVFNVIDPNHESMGANITVLAYRDVNSNGLIDATDILVDQFLTGADGNYFFDLVPDDYIIALDDDSLGEFTALDDSLTPAGFLKDYLAQWTVSSDYFQVWDYDANLEVPIDPTTDAPFPLPDGSGNAVEYHVNHINFLLDPGPPAAPEVVFNGTVIADINGDGVFNGSDTAAPGIFVFGDINRNEQFDSGEPFTSTDANGQYSLTVPSTSTAVINVGVQAPIDWVLTAPVSGSLQFFTAPGDTFSGVDFAMQPPLSGSGLPGSAQPGTILGVVFDDANADGIQQESEGGISNFQVYIDNNSSGDLDAGDAVTTTNSNGGYVFTNVPVGTHQLLVDVGGLTTLQQTTPIFGLPNTVVITGGNTVSDVKFGFKNAANLDFGDLPDQYGTRVEQDGPRHPKGIFFLGQTVDAELNGQPTPDALGDDNTGVNDEDGIFVDALEAGSTGRLEAVASRHGGYLQAWIDYNGDGDFNDVINGVSERIVTNALLEPGTNVLNFAIPDTIDATIVYARFRYGEFGLGLTGLAEVGEVEDYVLTVAAPAPLIIINPDFDLDGDTDGVDFFAWQRGFGLQTNALLGNGDSNEDGAVNAEDLSMVLQDFGQGSANLAALESPSGAAATASHDPGMAPALATSALLVERTLVSQTDLPLLVQPGFPEEYVAGVIDTGDASSGGTNVDLASIASEHHRRVAAEASQDAFVVGRSKRGSQRPAVRDAARLHQGFALRDQAFANHAENLERRAARLAERSSSELEEAEAIAVALDEEIDWRLN